MQVVSNYNAATPDMLDGLTRIVLSMSERLNDPAERQKFEEWCKRKGG